MKEKSIKVVKVAPGKKPEVVTLKNDLADLQKAVSEDAQYIGAIEVIGNVIDGTLIILNEEGKLIPLKPNRRYFNDILVGTFYIAGRQEDEFASLTDKQIEECMKQFDEVEEFNGNEKELEPKAEFYAFDWNDLDE